MTELEALRRVAEAAREFLAQSGRDWHAIRHYDAKQELIAALDALPAPDAPGEVVDIRAVCLQAIADKLAKVPKPRSYEMAHYCMGLEDAALAIQGKIVPLPRVTEVVGEVEG